MDPVQAVSHYSHTDLLLKQSALQHHCSRQYQIAKHLLCILRVLLGCSTTFKDLSRFCLVLLSELWYFGGAPRATFCRAGGLSSERSTQVSSRTHSAWQGPPALGNSRQQLRAARFGAPRQSHLRPLGPGQWQGQSEVRPRAD